MSWSEIRGTTAENNCRPIHKISLRDAGGNRSGGLFVGQILSIMAAAV